MNTNINEGQGLPSLESLQQLANEFFKGLPNEFPKEISLNPQEHPKANQFAETLYAGLAPAGQPVAGLGVPPSSLEQADNFNPTKLQAGLPDPYFAENKIIPANPGIGFSPSLSGLENPLSLTDTQGVFHNQHNTDTLRTPPSFSGAGISPSSTHFENPAGLAEPFTSNSPYGNFEGFNSIPKSVAGSGKSPSALQSGSLFNAGDSETILPDSQFAGKGITPNSAAGSGSSPSAVHHGNEVNIANPQTSLHDPHFAGDGKIPQSVAGSGKSPSAIEKETPFNINDPQTSLPDPHFTDGKVPQSVAGSGKSPSLLQNSQALQPALTSNESFESELQEILNSFSNFIQAPQLPVSAAEASPYYFLPSQPSHEQLAKVIAPRGAEEKKSYNSLPAPPFDVNLVKKEFPILQEKINGRQIIWLDNAATTQKPKQVIDRISYFYEHENSNVHRAAHALAARATDAYEAAREKVQRFINAASPKEIIFVRGATEAINLVAKSWGEQYLNAGDEIIISHLEHHANIVPWQQLAARKGLKLKVIPVDDNGQILLDEYAKLLSSKTKLVSITQVSNALGTVTPAMQVVAMAHAVGARALVDGAQSVSHMRVDVQALDADWFVFSGHKIFGPTGIGVVYGKEELLNATQPWQGGGNMIVDVTFEHTKYHNAPLRFEAGTGNIADAVGLGAALDYVSKLGIDLISQYEHYLLLYGTNLLKTVPGLRLIGTAPDKASVMSFVLEGFTNDEVGQALNKEGIAVRTGHHCAQPILRRFGVESSVRPSLAFYNTCADIDKLVSVLHQLKKK